MTIWHYPGCDTCRRARKWLASNELDVTLVHIVEAPPDVAALGDLWRRSGLPLRKWFNTSGRSYRGGGFKDRLPNMTEDEQLAALAADGKLIKRPVLDTGSAVLVGFNESTWAEALLG
jgi:arsenate reductase